ncbi:MAG: hypothetical protein ACLSIA_23680, partial [[Clostridium] innocuum]
FSGKRIKRGLYRSKNGILMNADINGGRTDDKTKYHLLGLDTLVIYILYPIYKIVNLFFAKFKTEAKESLLLYNLIISLISLYR